MTLALVTSFQFIFGLGLILTALIIGVMTRMDLLPSLGRSGGWLLWLTAVAGGSWFIYQAAS